MRALLLVSCLMVPLAFPAAAGSTTWEFDYVAPGTFATPALRTDVALCGSADEICIGGSTFPMSQQNAIAVPSDELWGTGAAVLVCAWLPGADGECGDGASSSVACGTAAVLDVPFIPGGGVAYLYTIYVDGSLHVCGATQGHVAVTVF